jgi:hypothetical protein
MLFSPTITTAAHVPAPATEGVVEALHKAIDAEIAFTDDPKNWTHWTSYRTGYRQGLSVARKIVTDRAPAGAPAIPAALPFCENPRCESFGCAKHDEPAGEPTPKYTPHRLGCTYWTDNDCNCGGERRKGEQRVLDSESRKLLGPQFPDERKADRRKPAENPDDPETWRGIGDAVQPDGEKPTIQKSRGFMRQGYKVGEKGALDMRNDYQIALAHVMDRTNPHTPDCAGCKWARRLALGEKGADHAE